ncbi:MAG: hypothetical protein WC516_09980 [Patescibacteria group bacterium]|jgi:hypothetical protein|nr:hypothetical protein [Sideroxydans sp.]
MEKPMKETKMTDYEFSKWLYSKGEWTCVGSGPDVPVPYTNYFVGKKHIAMVTYDNRCSTRKIFIKGE